MSILNMVVVRFPDGATDDERAWLDTLLRELRTRCDGVLRWEQGVDSGLVPGAADFGAAILFEDERALGAFLVHPVHEAIVRHLSRIGADWSFTQARLP